MIAMDFCRAWPARPTLRPATWIFAVGRARPAWLIRQRGGSGDGATAAETQPVFETFELLCWHNT